MSDTEIEMRAAMAVVIRHSGRVTLLARRVTSLTLTGDVRGARESLAELREEAGIVLGMIEGVLEENEA
jgi:hypothetical protein